MPARLAAEPDDHPASDDGARSDGVAGALAPRETVDPVLLRADERFYHPELDGLRFVAFLLVFVLHALPQEVEAWQGIGTGESGARWASSFVLSGRYGVDLFFALSSYLITELLLREWAKRGRLDVKSFYIRRALRIWPLYFVFLGLATLVVPLVLPGESLSTVHLVSFLLFAGNWSIAFLNWPDSVASPLWSVSIEEQFYIVWPLLIARIGPRRLLAATAVMIVLASLVRLCMVLARVEDRMLWTVTFARLEPIALGAALAVLLRGRALQLPNAVRPVLFLAGLFAWVAAARFNPGGPGNLVVYPVVAVGAVGMLLAALRDDSRGTMLASPLLTWLGRISYGLYVYHVLALDLIDHLFGIGEGSPAIARFVLAPLGGFAVTVALAALSYRFIESPFLHLKKRFTHVRSRD